MQIAIGPSFHIVSTSDSGKMIRIQLAYVALGLFVMLGDGSPVIGSRIDAMQVMRALLVGNEYESQRFDQENRDAVEFWIRAMGQSNEIMCNVDYLRKLSGQFKVDMEQYDMINMHELHKYVVISILESCSKDVVDNAEELSLPQEMKGYELRAIGFLYNRWIHGPYDPDFTFRYMAEYMLKMVGYELRTNKDGFMQAWENTPCNMILDKLEQPGMESLRNFIRMVTESEMDPLSVNSFELGYDIPMIQFCQYIQWKQAPSRVWIALQNRDSELENHVLGN